LLQAVDEVLRDPLLLVLADRGGATSEVRSDQNRSPMMASAMTEVMTMNQIGQPAASMMDSTCGFSPASKAQAL
jgi:hypothetical protein